MGKDQVMLGIVNTMREMSPSGGHGSSRSEGAEQECKPLITNRFPISRK